MSFFIYCLPRSGSAWLSQFLTGPDSFCYHEPFSDTRPQQRRTEKVIGAIDTSAFQFHKDAHIQSRSKPFVLVRDPSEIALSLAKLGVVADTHAMRKELDALGIQSVIEHRFLNDMSYLEDLWGRIIGTRFDADRAQLLREMNIQRNFKMFMSRVAPKPQQNLKMIRPKAYDVSGVQRELDAHPELWNEFRARTDVKNSPHREVDDIWVRYNAKEKCGTFDGIAGEHEPVWWPCVDALPSVKAIAEDVAGKDKLYGVFITRVPPGGKVYPHVDLGWHATTTQKHIVQIKGDAHQAFCFEGEELRAEDGDHYWFNNQARHWVNNDSNRERISLIMALRST